MHDSDVSCVAGNLIMTGRARGTLQGERFFLRLKKLTPAGTHNLKRATSMPSCHGVFTDQLIFRTILARILNTF